MTLQEFYDTAESDTTMAEVVAELRREREEGLDTSAQARYDRCWALLANQVVGQEEY